jgi:peroxiredoxin Q/BCP
MRTFFGRLFGGGKPQLLPVGSPAPSFSVIDHTGRTQSLAELRGKRVVLWFYPKASTPG